MKFKTVEQKIQAVLDSIADSDRKNRGFSDARWTKLIKLGLRSLGQELGHDVSAFGLEKSSEWMFDLMWSRQTEDDYFERVALAVEIEWKMDEENIFRDFEKLLVAKAPLKLMVFQQASKGGVAARVKNLTRAIRKFKGKFASERYLIAGYSCETSTFHYSIVV